MNILHVITTINRGGAENHLTELVCLQVAAGHRVTVAYLKGDGYWSNHLTSKGIDVVPLCMKLYGDIMPVIRLRRLLGLIAPDILHAHMPPAELYSCLAALSMRNASFRMIISKHNDEPFYRGPASRIVGRWIAQHATHVIAISEAVKKYVTRTGLHLRDELVTTVYYGIDTSQFDTVAREQVAEFRRQHGVADDMFLIGTVARFVSQKSLSTLLDAFALFQEHARRPARLILVGDGPLKAELHQRAILLGIDQSIIWAGFREDIPVVMHALDVFCLPSLYEGFGLVLLEAMASATAIVATRVSAIPEIVLDGETGVLVPPGDAEKFAVCFLEMQDDSYRKRCGDAGRIRARDHFTLKAMSEKTKLVYQQALA